MTATLVDCRLINGVWVYVIAYTDGTNNITLTYTAAIISDDVIQQTVGNELTRLEAVVAATTSLAVGSEVSPPAQVATPPQTAAQIAAAQAQAQFFTDLASFQQMQRAVAVGLMTTSDPTYTALQKQLQGEWNVAYLAEM